MDKIKKQNKLLLMNQYKFCTDIIWINWYDNKKKKLAVISLAKINYMEDINSTYKKNEVRIIHPTTEFLMYRYSSREYSTMKKHADNLVVFLNFLRKNSKDLKITSLCNLKISHGVDFLNYLGRERKVSKETVKQYERTLTNFYVFLSDKKILTNISNNTFELKENQWNKKYYLSPFKGVIYPEHASRRIEHVFPMNYFPLFLEIAILEAPRIALGIYLQFFGGIRVGEVVNIKRYQIIRRVKNGDFLISLAEQNFRTDIKDRAGSNVKRVREQQFYNIKNWLPILFEDHIERFKSTDGSNALFVNNRGKAMTAKSYSQYFNKVKNSFCNYLEVYGDEEDILVANHLRLMDWSTHIGRGTFTNMVAEHTDNPFLLAYSRGDKDPASSIPYIAKTEKLRKKIEDLFCNLNNDYLPKLLDRQQNINIDSEGSEG